MGRRWLGFAAATTALLLAGCIPGGPPTPEQIKDQFAESIEPAWEVKIDGIFGEPVIRGGLVFAYAIDEDDGMRLEVRSLDDGELVWEHVASPGGTSANGFLQSKDAASRPIPIPAIRPIVMERPGAADDEEPQLVVVFFERDIPEDGSFLPDDILRIADARTGELLEVTFEPYDQFEFRPYGLLDDGDVFVNPLDAGRACGEHRICFLGTDSSTDAYAMITLDVAELVIEYTPAVIPRPTEGETVYPGWGIGYASVLTDAYETFLVKYVDGQPAWRVGLDALFDDSRTSPSDFVDFVEVGDLVLIQGYQVIRETLDPALPHTLDLDFATSRTLIALDPDTGELVWRAPGVDMLCPAVFERPIAADATTIPVCHTTGGSFVFDLSPEELTEYTDLDASIAELTIADGSLGWEVPDVGENSTAYLTRMLGWVWAARGDLTVIAPLNSVDASAQGTTGEPQLLDLSTGEAMPIADDAQLVCKAEREDVLPEFEGSSLARGANPIATGYPAGWYHFPCRTDGDQEADWSKGGVRIAGYPETGGDGKRVVLPTEDGLAAFDLE
jgi:hypothetical protein